MKSTLRFTISSATSTAAPAAANSPSTCPTPRALSRRRRGGGGGGGGGSGGMTCLKELVELGLEHGELLEEVLCGETRRHCFPRRVPVAGSLRSL